MLNIYHKKELYFGPEAGLKFDINKNINKFCVNAKPKTALESILKFSEADHICDKEVLK
jgi:hypothetical protein